MKFFVLLFVCLSVPALAKDPAAQKEFFQIQQKGGSVIDYRAMGQSWQVNSDLGTLDVFVEARSGIRACYFGVDADSGAEQFWCETTVKVNVNKQGELGGSAGSGNLDCPP